MRRVVDCVVALGSNLGDRVALVRGAAAQLAEHSEVHGLRLSPLYESVAVTLAGLDASAPPFVNAVATLRTSLEPGELLTLVHEVEASFGRVRQERWGSRTLDIDIVQFGGRVLTGERLTIPHPRAAERDFVLLPWLDLEPDAVLLGHGRVRDVLARLGASGAAVLRQVPGGAS